MLLFKNLVRLLNLFLCSFEEEYLIHLLQHVRMCMINVIVLATFCINWQLFLAGTDYATAQNTVNFEAGSTSEKKSEITVVPDDDFETNETYIVTLFIRRSVLNRLNLMLMNSEALVAIENDDSKTKVYSLACMAYKYNHIHI